MEEKISIHCDDLVLEGLFCPNDARKAVIATHPHPLYGGNMYHPVVKALAKAFYRQGYATLRFNFRGAGASQGSYDNGEGEQRDLLAAASFLTQKDIQPTALTGYSFGTWINAKALGTLQNIGQMIMVSPPVAFMDFTDIQEIPCLTHVITGSEDDIAPPDLVKRRLSVWNVHARLHIIQGADHFYGGHISSLETVLSELFIN